MMRDDRGQLHTLEAVIASTVMLFVTIYAVESTSLTPFTSSTLGSGAEGEMLQLGQGLLAALDYGSPQFQSKLKQDLVEWINQSNQTGKLSEYFWNGEKGGKEGGVYINPETGHNLTYDINSSNLTGTLSSNLWSQGLAHNLEIRYLNNSKIETAIMLWTGEPSENAVTATRKLVIHNSDFPVNTTNASFAIPDIDQSSDLYNILEVRLTLWR